MSMRAHFNFKKCIRFDRHLLSPCQHWIDELSYCTSVFSPIELFHTLISIVVCIREMLLTILSTDMLPAPVQTVQCERKSRHSPNIYCWDASGDEVCLAFVNYWSYIKCLTLLSLEWGRGVNWREKRSGRWLIRESENNGPHWGCLVHLPKNKSRSPFGQCHFAPWPNGEL